MMARVAAFFERDLRLAAAQPYALIAPFFSIAITVAGFAYIAHIIDPRGLISATHESLDYFSYVVVNLAFLLLLGRAFQAVATAIRRDQIAGTLQPILTTSTPLWLMLVATSLWPVIFAVVQTAAYFAVAAAFGMHLTHVNFAQTALMLALSMTCMLLLGVGAAAAVIRFRQSPPATLFTGGAATLLSGALFPISLLPAPLQALSWLLPLTHALNGMRAAIQGNHESAVLANALWLCGAIVIFAPVALWSVSKAISAAKRDATLAMY